MWETANGLRKLEGAERRAFVIGLMNLLQDISDQKDMHEFDAEVLRAIEHDDKAPLVMLVAEHLLGDGAAPETRAWSDAIVWEVYETLKSKVELEIEAQMIEPKNEWTFFTRRAILDVMEAFDPEERPRLLGLRSTATGRWHDLVELLFADIMDSVDFLLYSDFADISPTRAADVKRYGGIEEDYFTNAPPALDANARERLDQLYSSLAKEAGEWFDRYERTGRLV